MWHKELGDWQERRHRRPPLSETLPSSNAHTGSSRFMYKLPTDAPAPAPMEAPKPYVPVHTRATEDHHLTAQWVTVCGARHGDIGNIREFLDLRVGRTVAHYTLSSFDDAAYADGARGRGGAGEQNWDHLMAESVLRHASNAGAFYVQFEEASAAARAVRISHFVMEAGWGVAAAASEQHRARVRGVRQAADDNEGDEDTHGSNSIEFSVTTCADRTFLAARAAAMQDRLWSDAEGSTTLDDTGAAVGGMSPSPAAAASSARVTLPAARLHANHADAASPGRRSATLEPPHSLSHTPPPPPPFAMLDATRTTEHGDEDDDEGDHPLLPRGQPHAVPSSSSSYSIDVAVSPSSSVGRRAMPSRVPHSTGRREGAPVGDGLPRLRQERDGAPGRGADSSLVQEEGHFIGRQPLMAGAALAPQQGNRSVVSLFFRSWLSTYDNVWVTVARGVLVVLWTLLRLLGALVQFKTFREKWSRWRARARGGEEQAVLATMDALSVPRPHHRGRFPAHRRRRGRKFTTTCADLAGASPIAFIANLFYHYCVFAPSTEEVDMTLWSWLTMRSPFPQQSLRELKRYLLLQRPCYSPGQAEAFRGKPFTHFDHFRVMPRVQTAEEAQEAEYYYRKGLMPPPRPLTDVEEPVVLLNWRPARVLTRYSLLSAVLVLFALMKLYEHWTEAE